MFTTAVILRALSTSTTSGNGAAVDLGIATSLDLIVNLTTVSGTSPTLEIEIETSPDGTTNWTTIDVLPEQIESGSLARTIPKCSRFVRARWTLGGTSPSFAFSITANAVLVYATPDDVRALGLPQAALGALTDVDIDRAAREESDTADSYLGAEYTLPLLAFGNDLRGKVCDLIALRLLRRRGANPDDPAMALYVDAKNDAIAWLERVAKGMLSPAGIIDSTPDIVEGGAYVVTDARRGW